MTLSQVVVVSFTVWLACFAFIRHGLPDPGRGRRTWVCWRLGLARSKTVFLGLKSQSCSSVMLAVH